MIMDTAYIGEAKTTVNGQPYISCPPIVGLELWQRANAMLKEPRRYVRAAVCEFAGDHPLRELRGGHAAHFPGNREAEGFRPLLALPGRVRQRQE
jgi:hypothetical protein